MRCVDKRMYCLSAKYSKRMTFISQQVSLTTLSKDNPLKIEKKIQSKQWFFIIFQRLSIAMSMELDSVSMSIESRVMKVQLPNY